ncbi:MAG: histidinol-phosphate transaminase [Bacteroidota bacterium]
MDVNKLLRDNIRKLKPYSSAREEYTGNEAVFLDANENPYNIPLNRYPDPLQKGLKKAISAIKNVSEENIFLGNGSDEAIDLLIRIFCEPGIDNVLGVDPSYGMYEVCAAINNVEYRKVLLTGNFQPDVGKITQVADENSKLLFLCSPNNPTGNLFDENIVKSLLETFRGVVVIDEAYIDFAEREGFAGRLEQYENLVVLQTFSKAWGLAGIRLGMAFASPEIIKYLSNIKYPYNVNILTQEKALEELKDTRKKDDWVKEILKQREWLMHELQRLDIVRKVFPSDANFFLIRVKEPQVIYDFLVDRKIIIRDRSKVSLCEGCLRITVGTPEENELLVKALVEFETRKKNMPV